MRIEYQDTTGCPYGQFVVRADNDQDRAIISWFVKPDETRWIFHLHGYGMRLGDNGLSNFNFGWSRWPPYQKKSRAKMLLASVLSHLGDLCLELARKV